MDPLYRFADEWEYEVFVVDGLIRDHSHQEGTRKREFNRKWVCYITAVSSFDRSADPNSIFVSAHVEQKFIGDRVGLVEPPRPGTDVTIYNQTR